MMPAGIGYQANKKHAESGSAYKMSRDPAYGVSTMKTERKEEFIIPADRDQGVYANQRTLTNTG